MERARICIIIDLGVELPLEGITYQHTSDSEATATQRQLIPIIMYYTNSDYRYML